MGLYVLPFGAHRVNQIDSFDHTALPAWLHGLRGSFDWIVFDGPSFTHVSDAELLANFADANLLVVRRADTPVAPVARAMDRIPPQSFLGAVVTPPLGER
jgi:Mrp family chromosome partitioning ATPase